MNNSSKISIKRLAIIFIVSFLVIFLFSIGTSPFYGNYYTSDSSIFITIGKAMKEGKILYKDIFDHKGPILFFIQMIGQYIYDGRFGIFILEVISLFITNLFLYKTLNLITTEKKSLFSLVTSMIFMAYFIETGNYSEEYSIPFLAICLYLGVKWIKNDSSRYTNKIYLYSFIYGICFSAIAFIRLNNALMICGLAIAISVILIKENKINQLIKCTLSFILGISLIALPIIIYFTKVDALYDMLYGTFIHNFLYISSNIEGNMLFVAKLIIFLIITALLFLNFKVNRESKDYLLLISFIYITSFLCVWLGPGFNNYYITIIPLISILMPPLIDIFASKNMNIIFKIFVISYVCLMFIVGCFIPQLYYKLKFRDSGLENINRFISDNISNDDTDQVLAIGLSTAQIYMYGDFIPCHRYAFMQDYLFASNSNLSKETYNFINDGNVKYIICDDIDSIKYKNTIHKLILEKYTKKDSLTLIKQNQFKEEPYEISLYELKGE